MAACGAPSFSLPGTVYRLFVLVFSSFIRQLHTLLIMADLYFFGNLHWTNPALGFHFLTFLSILFFFYKKILLSEFKIFFDWHLELRIHNLYLVFSKDAIVPQVVYRSLEMFPIIFLKETYQTWHPNQADRHSPSSVSSGNTVLSVHTLAMSSVLGSHDFILFAPIHFLLN